MAELIINDRIRDSELRYFNKLNINMKYDAFASTFAFEYNFSPDKREIKELSCIGHYHIAKIREGKDLLLLGNVLSIGFSSQSTRQLAAISGYSITGVLEDCSIPMVDGVPLQTDGLSLRQIAQQLLNKFGLKMKVDALVAADMDKAIDSTTGTATGNIKEYLTKLAKQRNIVISHTPQGELLFTRLDAKLKPIYHFTKQSAGVTGMSLSFNGQGMHSHITAVKQAGEDESDNAGQSETLRNPYVINTVYRPLVVSQSSGDDNDSELVAKQTLANELRNVKVSISLSTWLVNGSIPKPGQLLSITNDEIYLYSDLLEPSNWMIEEVQLSEDNQTRRMVLNCVLPEVYNGQTPKYLWKGINLH